jgi:hypothetical protein
LTFLKIGFVLQKIVKIGVDFEGAKAHGQRENFDPFGCAQGKLLHCNFTFCIENSGF